MIRKTFFAVVIIVVCLISLLVLAEEDVVVEEKVTAEEMDMELPPAIQEMLDRELEKLPPVERHFRKAQDYHARGKLTEAIAELNLALKEDPKHVPSNCELGVIYMGQEDYSKAIEQLQKTLKLDPSYPKTHYALANAYARKPDPDLVQARKELNEAIKLGYHPVPWFVEYLERQEKEKGIVPVEAAATESPVNE